MNENFEIKFCPFRYQTRITTSAIQRQLKNDNFRLLVKKRPTLKGNKMMKKQCFKIEFGLLAKEKSLKS